MTMMETNDSKPSHTRLFELASEQGGYFTAAQARTCGFSKALLAHHAKSGRFLRVRQGLYRLREYPSSPREDVIAAWLVTDSAESHPPMIEKPLLHQWFWCYQPLPNDPQSHRRFSGRNTAYKPGGRWFETSTAHQ